LTGADQAAPEARQNRLRRNPDRLRRRLRRHLRRSPPLEAHPDRLRRYDRLDWRVSDIRAVVGLCSGRTFPDAQRLPAATQRAPTTHPSPAHLPCPTPTPHPKEAQPHRSVHAHTRYPPPLTTTHHSPPTTGSTSWKSASSATRSRRSTSTTSSTRSCDRTHGSRRSRRREQLVSGAAGWDAAAADGAAGCWSLPVVLRVGAEQARSRRSRRRR
jgi:hypothetical protein